MEDYDITSNSRSNGLGGIPSMGNTVSGPRGNQGSINGRVPTMLGGPSGGVSGPPTMRSARSSKYKNGVAIPDFNNVQGMLADGDMQGALAYGHKLSPGASNEEIFNYVVAPGMIQNTYDRDYTAYRQRAMNPIMRQSAQNANMFFRNYGGMQGGPQMQQFMQMQSPFLDAQDRVEGNVMDMQNRDEEQLLNAMLDQYRYNMDVQHQIDRERLDRKANEPNPWMQGAGILGGVAGTILGGPIGGALGASLFSTAAGGAAGGSTGGSASFAGARAGAR